MSQQNSLRQMVQALMDGYAENRSLQFMADKDPSGYIPLADLLQKIDWGHDITPNELSDACRQINCQFNNDSSGVLPQRDVKLSGTIAKCVYVEGFPRKWSRQEVEHLFESTCGPVAYVHIEHLSQSLKTQGGNAQSSNQQKKMLNRGWCFVEFRDAHLVRDCVEMFDFQSDELVADDQSVKLAKQWIDNLASDNQQPLEPEQLYTIGKMMRLRVMPKSQWLQYKLQYLFYQLHKRAQQRIQHVQSLQTTTQLLKASDSLDYTRECIMRFGGAHLDTRKACFASVLERVTGQNTVAYVEFTGTSNDGTNLIGLVRFKSARHAYMAHEYFTQNYHVQCSVGDAWGMIVTTGEPRVWVEFMSQLDEMLAWDNIVAARKSKKAQQQQQQGSSVRRVRNTQPQLQQQQSKVNINKSVDKQLQNQQPPVTMNKNAARVDEDDENHVGDGAALVKFMKRRREDTNVQHHDLQLVKKLKVLSGKLGQ